MAHDEPLDGEEGRATRLPRAQAAGEVAALLDGAGPPPAGVEGDVAAWRSAARARRRSRLIGC
jgi:hypothetical protein